MTKLQFDTEGSCVTEWGEYWIKSYYNVDGVIEYLVQFQSHQGRVVSEIDRDTSYGAVYASAEQHNKELEEEISPIVILETLIDGTIMEEVYYNYGITRDGRVYSHPKYRRSHGIWLKGSKDTNGYLLVKLVDKNKKGTKGVSHRIHRLVAMTFIPNSNNLPEVNHINGIKDDNRVENLEWCNKGDNNKKS